MKANGKLKKQEDELLEYRREQAISDLRFVLATPQGRRFYWRLLQRANVFGASFTDSAARTAYLEGRRSVGIEAMSEANQYAPENHVLTLNEQLQVQREDESRRRSAVAQTEQENDD